jgi:cell division inhibitor SepF
MWFLKKKQNTEPIPMQEQIIFDKVLHASDDYLLKQADLIISSKPIVLNFDELDIDESNKAIAFLSGIVYATQGQVIVIKDKVMLFARDLCFEDGSLKLFIEEIN